MSMYEERAARNEALFRAVNDQVRGLSGNGAGPPDGPHRFVCECGNGACTEHVYIPLEVYDRVRSNPHRFVVLPGHLSAEIEDVVDQAERYVVVEKSTPVGRQVAELNDLRR
jgi:hypothetical protein